MIISYVTHGRWQIDSGKITVIGTNSPTVYYDLTMGLSIENDKVRVMDDRYNRLLLSKSIQWVGDLATYSLKKSLDMTLRETVLHLNEQQINDLHEASNQLLTKVQDCLFMTDLPLRVNYDGDLKKIFKFCEISIDDSIINSPYAIIETLINIQKEIGDSRVIGLTNVAHYLSDEQIQELLSLCISNQVSLVMIEFTSLASQYRYRGCDFYHIDDDFVDWHND